MNAATHNLRSAAGLAGYRQAMVLVCLLGTSPLMAQGAGHPPTTTMEVRQEAASMQDKIGAELDRSLQFVDERGYPFTFSQLFPGDRPVILVPGYYGCPDMCGQVMYGMLDALNEIDLLPGRDYLIVNVSVDPRETAEVAKVRKDTFLPKLHRVGGEEGWRFLTGEDSAIKSLCKRVGFRYFWAEHDNRFAHPGALLFVTPKGTLGRVITGTTFDSDAVRQAIVETSEGRLGSFWDDLKFSCLTWDPRTQTYSLTAVTVMRIGGALTIAGLAVMIYLMVRREKKRVATPVHA